MALIVCKDCAKEFSSDAARCVHCGARKPWTKIEMYGGGFVVTVFAIFAGIAVIAEGDHSQQAPTGSTAPITESQPQRPLDLQTTGMMLEKCVSVHLVLGDYLSDVTATPTDNLIAKCQIQFAAFVAACHDRGKPLEQCSSKAKTYVAHEVDIKTMGY
jgi:hypothetical protein